ncbi:MAG: (2Fe-2S)-binding protein [Boseongicola sp.]|nr:(2Fe-2S)-binding protein [Boseongicola sp.]
MPELREVSCRVNGENRSFVVDPMMPLLHVLRETLGLMATRFGCGEGTCGSCTVMVDGQAVMSCDLPAGEVAGKRVETAEGLDGDPPHPLVAAFLDHQAGQCGYCLPGILMAARALLERESAPPSRTRIAEALDGNLCRCGVHARILDAVEDAARRMIRR